MSFMYTQAKQLNLTATQTDMEHLYFIVALEIALREKLNLHFLLLLKESA